MLSLLVVDDEMIIAEGLYQMLQENFQDQLVVRRCFSRQEAQRILEENRIDILLTDIELVDGSGLDLHEWVRRRWPMIKVIYLSGYSDFDYARRALDQKALAYVLKSEGDPAIVETVQRAIQSIKDENNSLLRRAGEGTARYGRIHQLIYHAMHGGSVSAEQFQMALDEQHTALSVQMPVLLGYCYSEDPGFNLARAMSLAEGLLADCTTVLLTEMTSRAFLFICQSGGEDQTHLIHGLLENTQRILEKQNDLLTVCVLEEPVEWNRLMEAGEMLLEKSQHGKPGKG